MTYHMARVMHWVQNKSIDHYPSHVLRQHYQPPFTEYIILHLQILNGTDRWANLVQLFFFTNILLIVSLITKELGGNKQVQIVSIFLTATIPMAVLEANSTQNDLVNSCWVLASVYFLIRLLKDKETAIYLPIICTALSIGLAVFTKSISYIWLFPFCLGAGIYLVFVCRKFLRLTILIGTILTSILFLNAGHFYRNYKIYKHILGGTQEERQAYTNASHTLPKLLSNIIRNIALHLRTDFSYWNRLVRVVTLKIHQWLNLTIHEPSITYAGSGQLRSYDNWLAFDEDTAGNFFHFQLIVFTCILILVNLKKYSSIIFRYYLLACILGFLLFCIYLRWQEWHVRLHLPLFILFMPISAIMLYNREKIINFITPVFLIFSIFCLLFNTHKPVLPLKLNNYVTIWNQKRLNLYNNSATQLIELADYIVKDSTHRVGLILNADDGDYLYWVFLKNKSKSISINHINVTNPSGKIKCFNVIPQYIIASTDVGKSVTTEYGVYQKVKNIGFSHIYKLPK
ncbi:glycosyltransferase family 39 protein [Cytophagaceae bacterium DM2B3-1]|uniref:Glycosyltransferase family 39 protein n=1 Tax=Xanthocytophaga flava TaxID=3048013 RepID=A0ABT7CKP7_9BACT|nr:glycosyltransferase family 39 protein [Xanthocytophaga flavus]MDJ1469751.1 glycosyltransferase family 39 protein [Xanthocytophaga flavus]MDJ1494263.1 glycosyltransferase family 39 protein [Xanthocytophaga flavus]